MRERCRRASPRAEETKKSSAPSARISWLRIIQEYAAGSIVLGSDAWLIKMPREAPRRVFSRPDYNNSAQARMLESRAERSALSASLRGARHSSSRRCLEFSKSKDQLLNHTSKQTNDPSTIFASDFVQEACFDLHERYLFLRSDQNVKL